MGQEEGQISHRNVPEPGHIRSKKAKKEDQLPSFLLSPLSATRSIGQKQPETSQPRKSGQCGVLGTELGHGRGWRRAKKTDGIGREKTTGTNAL